MRLLIIFSFSAGYVKLQIVEILECSLPKANFTFEQDLITAAIRTVKTHAIRDGERSQRGLTLFWQNPRENLACLHLFPARNAHASPLVWRLNESLLAIFQVLPQPAGHFISRSLTVPFVLHSCSKQRQSKPPPTAAYRESFV